MPTLLDGSLRTLTLPNELVAGDVAYCFTLASLIEADLLAGDKESVLWLFRATQKVFHYLCMLEKRITIDTSYSAAFRKDLAELRMIIARIKLRIEAFTIHLA